MSINQKRKLRPKTVECVFLGYVVHSVGYRFLIINYGVPDMYVGNIIESRDATFFESEFPLKNAPNIFSYESINSHEQFILIEQTEEPHVHHPEKDDNTITRKIKRHRKIKYFGDDYIVYLMDDIPTTIIEAFSSPDVDQCKEIVRNKMVQ